MEKVTISKLKDQLSAYLKKVRAGQTVIVFDRNQPVARIEPVGSVEGDDDRIARLERAGLVRRAQNALSLDALEKRRAEARRERGRRSRGRTAGIAMRFWDASAIVPLLVVEPSTDALLDLLAEDPSMLVWWGTPVECTSAIARCERDGALDVAGATIAHERLGALAADWHELQPVEPVRRTAQRLLRVHPLRTADSLQLAAAILATEHDPSTLSFVSLDERLNAAASREGFRIQPT